MNNPEGPFVFDWDGDVRIYSSIRDMISSFELQDLECLQNKVAYDINGRSYIIGLVPESGKIPINKWDYNYPVKVFQYDHHFYVNSLLALLKDWYGRLKIYYPEANLPDLKYDSVSEIIEIAKEKGMIK